MSPPLPSYVQRLPRSSSPRPTSRASRPLVVALLAALIAVLLPAPSASAAERTVSGGRLDWGVKSSFQTYVTGPIAKGSWNLNGGTGTVGESQFRFHSASGNYDPDSGALRSAFSGGVRFVGHEKASGAYELDLTISNPSVRISGSSGTLHADIRSRAKSSGQVTTRSQVALASLNLNGVDMRGGSSPIALTGVPATLTGDGAKSFAGYYTAGAPLDPVNLSVDVTSADTTPGGSDADKDAKGGEGAKGDEPSKSEADFADAALDWGVRRTFREYVSGPIAEGKWKLAGGAKDGGALYRFPGTKGSYDVKKAELTADFEGSVHFTGKDVDVLLKKVSVSVKDDKGTLSADGTALVTFAAPLKPKKDLILVEEAPAKLTEEGAELFGSLYQGGAAMDPVTLAIALDESADIPALPDLGSDPADTASPAENAENAEDKAAEQTATESTSSGSAPPVLALSLAAALLVAVAAACWFVRRRRSQPVASPANSEE